LKVETLEGREVPSGLSAAQRLALAVEVSMLARAAAASHAQHAPSPAVVNSGPHVNSPAGYPYVTNWGGFGQNSRVSYQTLSAWNPYSPITPAQQASGYSTPSMAFLLGQARSA
jgi:hypothetical protein